ncbi:MAG: alpha/beta hydrolase [Dissulfuribacterales bacterium]
MQKQIRFASEKYQLYGTLHLPAEKNPPVVIGSHGLLSSGDSPKQIALAKQCNKNNIAFFRFDHRGCGKSNGDFSSATSFKGRCRDLISAIDIMQNLPEIGSRIGLFGSSFGGAIALSVAASFNIKPIVTVAAPMRSDTIKPPYITNPANTPMIQSLDKEKLFFDISNQVSSVSHLLIFHGDKDEIVPYSNALKIYENAKDPKNLICQKNGDHQMSNALHQKEFMDLAVEWYKAHF